MMKRLVVAVALVLALGGAAQAQGACNGPWLSAPELLALTADEQAAEYRRVLQCAEQGNADAQVTLGIMYQFGLGVPQDDAEAVRWYRLAAEQGDAGAQAKLGLMYGSGRGVPQDDAEAVRWYRLAAE